MRFWTSIFAVTVTLLLRPGVLADNAISGPGKQPVFDQQVLKFIADTIDWYRHLPTAQEIGTDPAGLLFLESNRSVTAEIVRLSFDFGEGVAKVRKRQISLDPAGVAGNRDLHDLMADKARLDSQIKEAVDELTSVTRAKLTAHHAEWEKLDTQMLEIRKRIEALEAMATNYEELLGFVRTASAGPDGITDMTALVENLERTVPGLSAAVSGTSNLTAEASHGHGIMGMISGASMVARKEQAIDGVIERTDALMKSLQSLRTPLTEPFRRELSAFSLDTKDIDILRRQQSRLNELITEIRATSAPIAALMKQQILLNLYRSHLAERRSEIQLEGGATWKALIRRVVVLAIAIAMVLGSRLLVRWLAYKQMHEGDRRRMLLFGNRVFFWLITIALVLYTFAFDLSSVATFLGLLSAGLAVGLHDVLLALGGYLVIVRKYNVRIGDRVQISNVTGIVTSLWLMQLELSEIDTTTGQRTGRVAFFSNSYVFVSPATPLFKQFSAPA
ncbi:MAG: mechanosensitive ion channel [Acidobacteriia bacterium]|nr:mechanosensitive ion channel [Terriglobia bacterium]